MITNDLTAQRAEMQRLSQMTITEIAAEFDHRCPACGGQLTPNEINTIVLGRPRRVITWPERCCSEFEF